MKDNTTYFCSNFEMNMTNMTNMKLNRLEKFLILKQDHFIGWFSHICFLVFVIFQLSTLRLESTLETYVDFTVVFSSI